MIINCLLQTTTLPEQQLGGVVTELCPLLFRVDELHRLSYVVVEDSISVLEK